MNSVHFDTAANNSKYEDELPPIVTPYLSKNAMFTKLVDHNGRQKILALMLGTTDMTLVVTLRHGLSENSLSYLRELRYLENNENWKVIIILSGDWKLLKNIKENMNLPFDLYTDATHNVQSELEGLEDVVASPTPFTPSIEKSNPFEKFVGSIVGPLTPTSVKDVNPFDKFVDSLAEQDYKALSAMSTGDRGSRSSWLSKVKRAVNVEKRRKVIDKSTLLGGEYLLRHDGQVLYSHSSGIHGDHTDSLRLFQILRTFQKRAEPMFIELPAAVEAKRKSRMSFLSMRRESVSRTSFSRNDSMLFSRKSVVRESFSSSRRTTMEFHSNLFKKMSFGNNLESSKGKHRRCSSIKILPYAPGLNVY